MAGHFFQYFWPLSPPRGALSHGKPKRGFLNRPGSRPELEALDERILPSTIVDDSTIGDRYDL
jgi:hypothetical protein